MARTKKKDSAPQELTRAKWQGFVNVYLSKQEKDSIKKMEFGPDDAMKLVEEACYAGYKFSCSYSPAGGFWSASMTGQYKELPNGGVCMSLKHSDLFTALAALRFCLDEAGLQQDWGERYTQTEAHDW